MIAVIYNTINMLKLESPILKSHFHSQINNQIQV